MAPTGVLFTLLKDSFYKEKCSRKCKCAALIVMTLLIAKHNPANTVRRMELRV